MKTKQIKPNPASLTAWHNNCLVHCWTNTTALFRYVSWFFLIFFFSCTSQSTKYCLLLWWPWIYCYFRQSYPLEKNPRDLTACWFYSPVIKGQTAQKEAYHWIPCHVFQYYKMIPALIFSPTLFETSSEEKRKKSSSLVLKNEDSPSFQKYNILCYFFIYVTLRGYYLYSY